MGYESGVLKVECSLNTFRRCRHTGFSHGRQAAIACGPNYAIQSAGTPASMFGAVPVGSLLLQLTSPYPEDNVAYYAPIAGCPQHPAH
jgi:hypothetical protein